MQTIATLTVNPAIDVNTSAPRVVPEHKVRCSAPRREPGGGGLNVSRAIQRLGGETTAVYLSGGHTGRLLESLLDRESLTHRPVRVDDLTRENLIVYEESSGMQYRLGMPGPRVTEAEAARLLEALEAMDPRPDWVVASGSLAPGVGEDFYAEVARLGGARGARVVVDTSGPALSAAAKAGVHLLKPNLRELCQLADCDVQDDPGIEEAARRLVREGRTQAVLVSLGAGGALLVNGGRCLRLRSPSVPIRSKVGAGDSMVAGLVLSLARGAPLEEAARYGVAAGAAAVMTEGTELCRLDDTERLFRQIQAEGA